MSSLHPFLSHRRVLRPALLLCLLVATPVAVAQAATGTDAAPLEPVIEVAAFGVTATRGAPGLTAGNGRQGGAEGLRSVRVARGDTWPRLLARLLDGSTDLPKSMPGLDSPDLPELLPGRYVRLVRQSKSWLLTIDYLADSYSAYRIDIGHVSNRIVNRIPSDELIVAARQDEMKSSLFSATDAVGLPEEVALQLVDIFAEEVDFLHGLEQGYRCAIVYEMGYVDGMPRPGRILAAEFSQGERVVAAYFFPLSQGEYGYFDASGMDINRVLRPDTKVYDKQTKVRRIDAAASFRRSPLEFTRITSVPAKLRYHPILKEWRAHRGTDYGAAIGTRVKATADGEVYFVGNRGSYGNLVILRHYNRFTTFYGHLNGFAAGLDQGDSVRKGQVIGYVGMTGLATGPHLHYEFHDDLAPGALDVPLVVRGIPDEAGASFRERVEQYRGQLAYAYRANMVLLE
jgi:murein DD-endopeptidase MepM/ murein hydrolase activator NlpD